MATPALARFCAAVLEAELTGGRSPALAEFAPDATGSFPLFVTWDTIRPDGERELRGCIGTFEAQPLEEGLRRYALIAALEDSRFPPITADELPSLECSVSLLTDFEPAADALDWVFGEHGVRVSFRAGGRAYSATYLPDVPAAHFRDKAETLQSLVRKAGYRGAAQWRELGLRLVRYRSSKAHFTIAG
ncbi:AMMECR1-domain-containing protein [Dipodascopsis tothii]|uniref:AMMECR1-domain-containing protein n=1 Tax=Dipodascopsis tothii TaxID=44089 RepID=UPI0034CE36E1